MLTFTHFKRLHLPFILLGTPSHLLTCAISQSWSSIRIHELKQIQIIRFQCLKLLFGTHCGLLLMWSKVWCFVHWNAFLLITHVKSYSKSYDRLPVSLDQCGYSNQHGVFACRPFTHRKFQLHEHPTSHWASPPPSIWCLMFYYYITGKPFTCICMNEYFVSFMFTAFANVLLQINLQRALLAANTLKT